MAKDMARSNALNELASMVSASVTTLYKDYAKRREHNQVEDLGRNTDQMITTWVEQTVQGYRTTCEKYTYKDANGRRTYVCYLVVELNKEDMARSLYRELSKDEMLRLDYDYEKFKSDFEKELNRHDKNR